MYNLYGHHIGNYPSCPALNDDDHYITSADCPEAGDASTQFDHMVEDLMEEITTNEPQEHKKWLHFRSIWGFDIADMPQSVSAFLPVLDSSPALVRQ